MESNIKNKNNLLSKMKRIIILPFIMIFFLSSAYSVGFEFDTEISNQVISDYSEKDDFTKFYYDIIPNLNDKTVSGSNLTYDEKIELYDVTDNIYLIYTNTQINQTINVGVFNAQTGLISQELTLNELGEYYFRITPSFEGEDLILLFDSNATAPSVLFLESEKESEFFSLFSPLINGTKDLIDINITIIRTLFYTFMFVVIVLFVSSLFWAGFKMIKVSKDLNKKEGIFETVMNNSSKKKETKED